MLYGSLYLDLDEDPDASSDWDYILAWGIDWGRRAIMANLWRRSHSRFRARRVQEHAC